MDKLEEQIAHLTRAIEDIHEMVLDHGKRIEVMERRVQLLMAQAAQSEAENTGGVVIGDEKPPHY